MLGALVIGLAQAIGRGSRARVGVGLDVADGNAARAPTAVGRGVRQGLRRGAARVAHFESVVYCTIDTSLYFCLFATMVAPTELLQSVHAKLRGNPELRYEALISQLAQQIRQDVKKQAGALRRMCGKEGMADLVDAFERGQPLGAMAKEHRLPVCDLLRLMLPELCARKIVLMRPGRREPKLKELLADPQVICERFRERVLTAVAEDTLCSPAADEAARLTGLEYEHILVRKLSARGIPFRSEAQLRLAGAHKTPDVELQIPIEVRGHIVHWIDSKAMYAGRDAHAEHHAQFRSYVNRFGPGMVIYWFGHADSLPLDEDVLVCDDFPEAFGTCVPLVRERSHATIPMGT